MSSMFDVTSTMSDVATDKMQQMQDAQDQVENIGRRVDSLQVEVQESLSGIDNSIQKIEDITDSILSATRSSIQEQTIQSQLMESEAENDAMKRKEIEDSGDTDQSISIIKKALEKLQVDVNTILDNYRTNGSNDVKDITSAEQGVLKTALSIVFGGSVIASLFMSSDEEPVNEEKTEDAGTTETQNQPQVNSEVKEDADAPVEQMPTAEPPGDGETHTEEPQKAPIVEQKEDMLGKKVDLDKNKSESVVEPGKAYDEAMRSKKMVEKDGVFYYPDGIVLGDPDPVTSEAIINRGGEIYESWAADMGRDDLIKDYPEFFKDRAPISEAKKSTNGEQLSQANKTVEDAEDANRVKMAQNVINVVNQPAQKQEAPKQKTPVVIGKVTPEQILT